FLSILPFVKMVAVCNVLGYFNAKDNSDIDFLIITSVNRIWTARFFATGFFKVLNLRPTKRKTKNRFCFSFYVTQDNLDLKNIALENDVYFYFWLSQLLLIYDQDDYFNKLVRENQWVQNFLINFNKIYKEQDYKKYEIKPLCAKFKKMLEKRFFNSCENFLKKWQKIWMPKKIIDLANDNIGVIISDKILKFHLNDKRFEFIKKWEEKIIQLNLKH
ncbi:hypothetical protein L6278_03195, partial [Candidatus Parcubacteria bacterium]|nr:hypothetical protein [Candidatus Parcubacteria bacterium]